MKRGQLKSFIFLILIGVLVIGFVSAFTPAPMPGFTPPTESKYKPPFSYVGLKDSDKWKGQGEYEEQPPDKDDAGKWDSYDREIISQLTAGELNQHKEEAAKFI